MKMWHLKALATCVAVTIVSASGLSVPTYCPPVTALKPRVDYQEYDLNAELLSQGLMIMPAAPLPEEEQTLLPDYRYVRLVNITDRSLCLNKQELGETPEDDVPTLYPSLLIDAAGRTPDSMDIEGWGYSVRKYDFQRLKPGRSITFKLSLRRTYHIHERAGLHKVIWTFFAPRCSALPDGNFIKFDGADEIAFWMDERRKAAERNASKFTRKNKERYISPYDHAGVVFTHSEMFDYKPTDVIVSQESVDPACQQCGTAGVNEGVEVWKVFEQDGFYGYRDAAGNVTISPRFHRAEDFKPNGTAIADGDYIELIGQPLFGVFYAAGEADHFSDGLMRYVGNGGKVGFLNPCMRVVLEPKYDWAGRFKNGYALVCEYCDPNAITNEQDYRPDLEGKWYVIDRDGTLQSRDSDVALIDWLAQMRASALAPETAEAPS